MKNYFNKKKYFNILYKNFKKIKNFHIKDFFLNDKKRFNKFSINFMDIMIFDYSKNIMNDNTIKFLLKFAEEIKIKKEIEKMFSGKKINKTENNSVLHIALRKDFNSNFFLNKKNIMIEIKKCLKKMKNFSKNVINGTFRGFTNKKITDVVNIGIGGSELGPKMVNSALKDYRNHLKVHYLSNIDNNNLIDILNKINLETSIFFIVSKTFTTYETIKNAKSIKKYFNKKFNKKKFFSKHFYAISNNKNKAIEFGINKKNIFKIFNWTGGRYSVWSSVGLSIMLSIGYKNFKKFLYGANKMDNHFYKTPYNKNIPIILSLISFWYNIFFNAETEAILTYSNRLNKFTKYIQQLNMESNGKNVDKNGKKIFYNTSQIIWGGVGTNCQHSFFQLLHQGTRFIPCDFISFINNNNDFFHEHNINLLSNFFAQTKALAFGNSSIKKNIKKKKYFKNNLNLYKNFFGNVPSNSILFKNINPESIGVLLSMYEHKIFSQGIILNIFSFDQWGVELGKNLSDIIYKHLKKNKKINHKYDSSTDGLIKYYKKWKK
ncbi:glucose-6-phosphate isomerase [Buchnera aphidicola (Ceratovacuna keduensis)]|uniref:glucose-6-phosphate isomerase n=1 Tax=Buchnera aphidicola TaxID=9 RepID=UPI0031B8163E